MKKIIRQIIIIILGVVVLVPSHINAISKSSDKNSNAFETYIPESLEYDEYTIDFYKEYKNYRLAKDEILRKYNSLIVKYNKEYEENLKLETYDDIQNAIAYGVLLMDDDQFYKKAGEFVGKLDILENTFKNSDINILYKSLFKRNANEFNSLSMLAISTPANENSQDIYKNVVEPAIGRQRASFNKSNAINYAKKHATNRNSSYKSLDLDCTNFASQILRAGGWSYTATWRYSSLKIPKTWSRADYFVKYWSKYDSTTWGSFNTLTTYVRGGDFITYDSSRDGDWDHVAFVTARSSSYYRQNGRKYYSTKIAQHTSDYHKWAYYTGWQNFDTSSRDRYYRYLRFW